MLTVKGIEATKYLGPHPADILVVNPQQIRYEEGEVARTEDSLKISWPRRRYHAESDQLINAQDILANIDHNMVEIIIKPTSYTTFLSSEWRFGINSPSPLSVGALTFTSDDYLVLGQRSQTVGTEPEQIHIIPAGYMQWSDVTGSKIWREPHQYTLARELQQELGIRQYAESKVMGIINRWTVNNPMIVAILRLTQSKDRLQTLWQKRQEKLNEEHQGLVFCKSEDIIPWREEHKMSLTEHLHSALLLYAWYAQDSSFWIGGVAYPRTSRKWVGVVCDWTGQEIGRTENIGTLIF